MAQSEAMVSPVDAATEDAAMTTNTSSSSSSETPEASSPPFPMKTAFRGTPLSTRAETSAVMKTLFANEAPTPDHAFGQGPFILSDIPASTNNNKPVILGIDEAGRGSVLGPMIYGCAYWTQPSSNDDNNTTPPKLLFADSKQLTEDKRVSLWKNQILADADRGFCVRVLTAAEISRHMQQTTPYNLNQMSHDAAIQMIQRVLDQGVNLVHCYIDTVGNPEHYQRRLEQVFGRYNIQFTVEPKADDKYPPCQAASIVAKVTRDFITQDWSTKFPKSLGSGYPSDPTCKAWIQHELLEASGRCPVMGFSPRATPLVRFSWNPIRLALDAKDTNEDKKSKSIRFMEFAADRDDDDSMTNPEQALLAKRQRQSMQAFLGNNKNKKRRFPYMERKGIQTVASFL